MQQILHDPIKYLQNCILYSAIYVKTVDVTEPKSKVTQNSTCVTNKKAKGTRVA